MNPIALEIGSFSIRWYGVMAALGFLAASFLLEKNRKYVTGLTKDQCGTMIIIALIAGILGARTYHVIEFFHEDGFDQDPITIFYIHRGGLEDKRNGLGLGMLLIRSTAALHGGTVLIDHPENTGTRITVSFTIRQNNATLRSPRMRIDYAGERDHGLIELSDVLPASLYGPDTVN